MLRKLSLLFFFCLPLPSLAQAPNLEGFWTQTAPGDEGKVLLDKLPPGAVFINDAGGGELGEGDFAGLQLSDKAKEEIASYDFADELSRDYACATPSVAMYMQAPFPMEIYQDSKLLVFKMEYYDMTRVIFMDGRDHPPADAPHFKSGHSVGHWEGDELVVDTTHISSASLMNNGFSHSDNLHMTERFKLSSDGKKLLATQVYEDPEVFKGLGARLIVWRKVEGEYVYPYECDPSFGN